MSDNSDHGQRDDDGAGDSRAQPQYSLPQILGIWLAVTLPMGLLAWVATPALIPHVSLHPGIVFWLMMLVGLSWQFTFALLIVRREEGDIRWATLRRRMWYQTPRDPRSGQPRARLLWWVVPFMVLRVGLIALALPDVVSWLVPAVAELPTHDLGELATPAYEGAWWLMAMALVHVPLNYFLAEEFLFRGILLPRMRGVFGRWDWFANGVLFGLYHVHKPLIMFWSALLTGFVFSYPARRFRSNWMAVIIHGAEGIVVLVAVLGIVLGVAQ